MAFSDGDWREITYLTDLLQPVNENDIKWIDLSEGTDTSGGGLTVGGLICEIRRSGIDQWWSPWNLAASAFELETEPFHPGPRDARLLTVGSDAGTGDSTAGSWQLQSNGMSIDLAKTRAAATAFSFSGTDTTSADPNASLLSTPAGADHQGVFATPIGASPWVDETVRCMVDGNANATETTVEYHVSVGEREIDYDLRWTATSEGLSLYVEKAVRQEIALWESAAWRFTFDTRICVAALLGDIKHEGRTGIVRLPAVLHFPRFGSVVLESDNPEMILRWDTNRPANRVIVEVKLAERAQSEGHFLQQAGKFSATLTMRPYTPTIPLKQETPESVVVALRRTLHTAITFRPDTGTLSNNSASIHCPICMDNWAEVTLRVPDIGTGTPGSRFLQYSVERWLNGGPGYASGTLRQDEQTHPAEDEYLMTGTAALLGLAQWLTTSEGKEWAPPYLENIRAKVNEMAARDLDGDGLVESPYRTGVSGTGQWSTCWLDVLSFGWKDAFSNALLYGALRTLAPALHDIADEETATYVMEWAKRLKEAYLPAFYNPATGWLAGWRCKEDHLHDYAFPQLNGAAVATGVVDPDPGREILERLLAEMKRVNVPSAELGLPGNLWEIPDADRADIMYGFPMGYYQNGGRTHAQTRHFVNGLYVAGLKGEADSLLETLCLGLGKGLTYGGNQSGVDWRYWDDRPCGYEGLLTDQFGLLGTALARYGLSGPATIATTTE
jgi:hypothetical protein